MKVSRSLTLAALMAFATSPAFAFNLGDAVNAASALQNGNSKDQAAVTATSDAATLLNTVKSSTGVTSEQAIGGTSAMLGLAKNNLSTTQYTELTKSVPGLSALTGNNALSNLSSVTGLLGKTDSSKVSALNNAMTNVKTTADMNSAFSQLGMNSSMVTQFAPVILQYLGTQGTSGSVLQSLGSLWGTTSAATGS